MNIKISGQTSFGPAQDLFPRNEGETQYIKRIHMADLDGNGLEDIVAITGHPSNSIIYYKNINGIFSEAIDIYNNLEDLESVTSADLNNDGHPDVIAVDRMLGQVAWYPNNGNGNFNNQNIIVDTASNVSFATTGDINKDGFTDVILASHNQYIYWLKNDGFGNFGMANIITYSAIYVPDLEIIDIDNDGDIDILAAVRYNDAVIVYYNNGNNQFTPLVIADSIDGISDVKTADLNADGRKDILTGRYNGKFQWFKNEGNLNYSPQPVVDEFHSSNHLDIGDIDNDGDIDILIAGQYNYFNDYHWLKNDGNGTFTPQHIEAPSYILNEVELLLSDVDSDGDKDIIWTQNYYYSSSLLWYENTNDGDFLNLTEIYTLASENLSNIQVLDIDEDGDQDIVYEQTYFLDALSFIANNSDGTYAIPKLLFNEDINVLSYQLEDIDNDNDKDIILIRFNPGSSSLNRHSLIWLENQGNLEFGPFQYITEDSANIAEIFIQDLDNDGDKDVLTRFNTGDDMIWYENDGTGSFSNSNIFEGLGALELIDFADIDADGDIDILTSISERWNDYNYVTYEYSYGFKTYYYENNGDGSFIEPSISNNGLFITALEALDYDDDGDIDIAVSSNGYGSILLFSNDGAGNLDSLPTYIGYASEVTQMKFYDLDNDDDLDIVLGMSNKQIGWLENNDSALFSNPIIPIAFEEYEDRFYIMDYDNDGDGDILNDRNYQAHWFENLLAEETMQISGQVFWDKNQDTLLNGGDEVFKGHAVTIEPQGYIVYTDNSGNFNTTISDTGSHELKITAPYLFDCLGRIQLDNIVPETLPFSFDFEVNSVLKQDIIYSGEELNCKIISGYIFKDNNNNGVKDPSEDGEAFYKVDLEGMGSSFTNNDGYFEFRIDEDYSGELSIDVINEINTFQCAGAYTIDVQTFPTNDEGHLISSNSGSLYNLNFGINSTTTELFDVGLFSLAVYNGNVAGETFHAWMDFKSLGSISETCSLKIEHSPLVSLVEADIPPATQAPTFVEWIFPPGSAPEFWCMQMDWVIDSAAVEGDTLHWEATYNCPPGIDGCLINNSIVRDVPIVNGPLRTTNGFADLRSVNAEGIMPTFIKDDAFLSYVITFQNPLDATAYNVSIIDTLPSSLDLSTITRPFSSYPFYDYSLSQSGILKIDMNNINLSNANEDKLNSYGFLQFNIQLKEGLEEGTIIPNEAYILFNAQEPVATNTVIHQLDNSTSINNIEQSDVEFSIAPNPFNNHTILKVAGQNDFKYDLEIVDVTGKIHRKYAGLTSNEFLIHKNQLPGGMYFVNIYESTSKVKQKSIKLIVQ